MFEGAGSETLRNEVNAPSGSLGAIDIGGSPIFSAFSEEAIRESQATRTHEVDEAHGGEDPFRGYFIGVENSTDLSKALSLFDEAQQAFNRALALYQEAFSKSRAELSRCEADLLGFTEERNALKLVSGQKEEKIEDIRAELAKAHQDQTDLIGQVMKILKAYALYSETVDNISISQLQQKVERIEQFREEFNMMKAETLGWKESMDRFVAEKEAARSQLSSVESQLRGMKYKSSAQAKKIEELEARLASELAKAKSEAEKAKAEAKAIVAVYRADAEAAHVQARKAAETAQTRAHWITELAKCQSQRETLEEIQETREQEADAGALASSDDNDDDDGSKGESENGEDLDGEEAAPEEN
ncbi:uncharacterized protein [Nicotiana tomentosiformis]|uniref:uncharacterized protein n=1 Tax=Nicotiana tomentosiformis TaxID=4098 RepID=UPI00388C4A7F